MHYEDRRPGKPSMSHSDDPAELIRREGDRLERYIYGDESFANEFSVYPMIWREHILSRRLPVNPMRVEGQWEPFASSAYTAIVRSWGCYQASKRIGDLCVGFMREPSADTALEVHRELVCFFACAGGVRDRLVAAHEAFPLENSREYTLKAGSKDQFGSLEWFYDRRTQYVHKVIVPCFDDSGLLALDPSMLKDANLHWKDAKGENTSVDDFIKELWPEFIKSCNSIWWGLYQQLTKHRIPESRLVTERPAMTDLSTFRVLDEMEVVHDSAVSGTIGSVQIPMPAEDEEDDPEQRKKGTSE